ncbi:MAG: carbohydrate binding domain-containing protein, partial [Clostridia bacterium]|nr:carbohydrate binding domain-containing protein [Clostridia bacterium]
RESSGWWKPVDQSGWSWVPAQLRGVPPISGGIGSLAYNWDVDLVTERPSVKLESIPTISATAGKTAVGLIPFTERSGSMDQSIRVRLFKDGAYYATTTLTAAADTTGASAGSGLLKVSVNTPDYLPSGTYAVKPYACDVALKNGDTLLNLTLTACNKTAGVGQLDQVTVEGANKETVENTVDVMINGGFENGNNNWSLTSSGATVVGSSFAQDGEGYGVLDRRTSTATAQLYCNQFAVQPNTEYTLSFWKYSEVATQTYYTVHYCNSSNGIISSKNGGTGYVATDGWQQITTTFTTSAETAYLRIDLSHNAGASQSVSYIDNVSVRATADPAVNLLPNGSFESGMSGWSSGGSAPASVVSSPATHSGNGMLKLDRSSGTDAGVNSYLLDVEANKTYTVTYWHRIVGQAQSYVYIYLKSASGYSGLGAKNVISVTNGWQQKSFTFTTKADTTQVRVDFNCNAYTGVAYIDDVTLTTTVNESVSTTADKTVLTVNGKPYSPILYLRTFGKNSLYYDRDLLSVFAESDVRLYSTYGGMLGNVTTTGATPV